MVDEGKRLEQTNARKSLSSNLRKLLMKQNRAIELLEGQVEGGKVAANVEAEMVALRAEIEEEFENLWKKSRFILRKGLWQERASST